MSSVINQPVTITATVIPQYSGAPTGTVAFYDGSTPITGCSNQMLTPAINQSTATCQDFNLSVTGSPHTLKVVYGGESDGNFSGNTGSTTQIVTQAMTM